MQDIKKQRSNHSLHLIRFCTAISQNQIRILYVARFRTFAFCTPLVGQIPK